MRYYFLLCILFLYGCCPLTILEKNRDDRVVFFHKYSTDSSTFYKKVGIIAYNTVLKNYLYKDRIYICFFNTKLNSLLYIKVNYFTNKMDLFVVSKSEKGYEVIGSIDQIVNLNLLSLKETGILAIANNSLISAKMTNKQFKELLDFLEHDDV